MPEWAIKTTLEEHANDPREHTYTLSQLVNSETHDEIWNAAQTQLREEGIIHNYLRMLMGKKNIGVGTKSTAGSFLHD